MKRIINARTKRARAKQERKESRKIRWYARKVIHFIAKQYKKTGNTVIDIDVYRFNEEKLIKVLQMLQLEKQITYIKADDLYTVTILLPKTTQHNIQEIVIKEPEKETVALKQENKQKSLPTTKTKSVDEEEYKPF